MFANSSLNSCLVASMPETHLLYYRTKKSLKYLCMCSQRVYRAHKKVKLKFKLKMRLSHGTKNTKELTLLYTHEPYYTSILTPRNTIQIFSKRNEPQSTERCKNRNNKRIVIARIIQRSHHKHKYFQNISLWKQVHDMFLKTIYICSQYSPFLKK